MKKHIRRIWSVVLAALMCVALLPVTAHAATVATATIPVSVTVEGEEGTLEADIPEETYTFTLEAVTADAPLPAETTVTITGAGSASYTIDYEKVGVYQYTVTQNATALTGDNSACHDRGNYDTTVYYVTVSVINADDGSIGTVVAVHEGSDEGDKCDKLVFVNTYAPVPYTSITVNKTWTDNDQSRPDSIEVQLLDGDEVIETVTLKEGTGWTYTWIGLDPYGDHSWDVKEVAVSGYTAEYTTSDDTITIHNVGDENEPDEPDESDEPDEPETTESETPDDPDTTTSAQTGDTANIALYAVLMVGAAAVMILLAVSGKRKKTA